MKIEKMIGDRLKEKSWTLSTAESCTGGLISDRITDVSGSSDYFEGGVVSYSVKAKAKHLGIPITYVERYGAVSPQVAKRMAEAVRKAFRTTIGLSTTGVAGPTGGTKKTPVGTVFIGVADKGGLFVKKLNLKGNRREIKEEAAEEGLKFLQSRLMCSAKNSEFGFRNAEYAKTVDQLRNSEDSMVVLIRRAPEGITKRRGRLGIFPASFNPPTKAHLALIREARKQTHLDEILVLLDLQAMDKRLIGATWEERIAMIEIFFRKDPTISIGLSNRGLFLDKLEPLKRLYPSPMEFTFIVGFDTLIRILDKKYYKNRKRSLDELFEQSHFLVANRDEYEERAFEILFRKRENKRYLEKIAYFCLPKRFGSLSSTLVRKRIDGGRSVDEWVPAGIARFIKETGLYAEKR